MHTRDCALSEVSVMDPQGQPVYRQAPGSEAFQAAMERLVQSSSQLGNQEATAPSQEAQPPIKQIVIFYTLGYLQTEPGYFPCFKLTSSWLQPHIKLKNRRVVSISISISE